MRRVLALTALVALLAGGCGIPDDTGVTVVREGPSSGAAVSDDGVPAVPNPRSAANDPETLVDYYLEAAAGDPDGALSRVKAFLSDQAAQSFEPGPEVRVIRLKGDPLVNPGDPVVTFQAQQIGTLKSTGELEPNTDASGTTTEYKLRVGPVAGQSGYFVLEAPKVLLLADSALQNFYQRRTVYFWNNANTSLIPDLRYMPSGVPSEQQPTTVLMWVVNGPAAWLGDTAHGLPTGTTAPDNVPAVTNGTLQVKLSAQAVPSGDSKALDRLRRQLQWSFRQLGDFDLELTIGHQDPVRFTDDDFLTSNPAARLARVPEKFVIYNNAIRRLTVSARLTDPVPLLKPAENKGIVAAAMSTSRTHTFAAVLTGTGTKRKLRVAAAPTGEQAGLKDVGGISGALGRPVWAVVADNDPAGAVGLITVNGKLYSFGSDGSAARPVEWQGSPGPITAVSVAPDGYRVALVSGGRLYRTVLDTGGDSVTMSTPEQLLPPTFSSITAAAWTSETHLAVAGVRADGQRYAVSDVSLDGALSNTRLADIGNKAVTYLTAYPSNPVNGGDGSDNESYEAAGVAWDVLGDPVEIKVADLASPPPNPPAGVVPTAPFFLD
jgi:hypothetical protein